MKPKTNKDAPLVQVCAEVEWFICLGNMTRTRILIDGRRERLFPIRFVNNIKNKHPDYFTYLNGHNLGWNAQVVQ